MTAEGSGAQRDPGIPTPRVPGDGPRRLQRPPSSRYGKPSAARGATDAADAAVPPRDGSTLPGPLARALLAAVVGTALLVLLGAVLASTAGLLFASGVTGAAIGLLLSRAAVPGDDGRSATPRRTLVRIAVALALVAVASAAAATWLVALGEGGTLGPIDYLLTTFGPFVPAEALVAGLAAWWGASMGPVMGA